MWNISVKHNIVMDITNMFLLCRWFNILIWHMRQFNTRLNKRDKKWLWHAVYILCQPLWYNDISANIKKKKVTLTKWCRWLQLCIAFYEFVLYFSNIQTLSETAHVWYICQEILYWHICVTFWGYHIWLPSDAAFVYPRLD